MKDGVAVIGVAVELPHHGELAGVLTYISAEPLAPGTIVRVPLGKRTVRGVVWQGDSASADAQADGSSNGVALRAVTSAAGGLPPLSKAWRDLVAFAAGYYQRGIGELAVACLPPQLRLIDDEQLARVLAKLQRAPGQSASRRAAAKRAKDVVSIETRASDEPSTEQSDAPSPMQRDEPSLFQSDVPSTIQSDDRRTIQSDVPSAIQEASAIKPAEDTVVASAAQVAALTAVPVAAARSALVDIVAPTAAQSAALDAIASRPDGTTLLWGVTGSGKTEVYLRATQRALDAGRQVLVLVPEINLTPQLEARFARRFAAHRMASLHSALTPAQRLAHWLMAHTGRARLVLGTRLAIFASLPDLGLIVVDEEHDPSYKQQEGARYSARDLAVWRGQHERVPVLLGSATPSLETWHRAARSEQRASKPGYARVDLRERIGAAPLPEVKLVDMRALPREVQATSALAPSVLVAMREVLARGEQSMVLLNRRGYAPVLHCPSCGWKSACPHCSAWRVFHKIDRTLRCHHCGFATRVPRACPECGDIDIAAVGRGTQKLEEQLIEALPGARIMRIDADSVRHHKGALEEQLAAVHAGEVDVLVGTQMVAKGHDFRRMALVVAANPDSALFSSDFRAPERLFGLLMQAAGRAGRDATRTSASRMWLQTWHPDHGLYAALRAHDYEGFAAAQLAERRRAGLPPFSSLALLRADAKAMAQAQAFLADAAQAAQALPEAAGVALYPPVPLPVARVADVERMQMLVESRSRVGLQRLLAPWAPRLREVKARHKGVLRYAVDVDPLAI